MSRPWRAWVAVAVAAFLLGRATAPRAPAPAPRSDPTSEVDDLLAAIRANYVDSLDDAELARIATQGIVARLRDPYSRVFSPDEYRRAQAVAQAHDPASRALPAVLDPDSIGVVTLSTVNVGAARAVQEAVAALQAQGLRALILDLRGNLGGFVKEAAQIADQFLDENVSIGWLKGRSERQSRRFVTVAPQQWPDLPLVILVDGRTTSAAELIAGSLQEHDRAVVVGTRTFGKGLAQTPIRLRTGVVVELTTARWYTAGGRALDRGSADSGLSYLSDKGRPIPGVGGVMPDVEAAGSGPDGPLEVGVRLLRESRTTGELLAHVQGLGPRTPGAAAR